MENYLKKHFVCQLTRILIALRFQDDDNYNITGLNISLRIRYEFSRIAQLSGVLFLHGDIKKQLIISIFSFLFSVAYLPEKFSRVFRLLMNTFCDYAQCLLNRENYLSRILCTQIAAGNFTFVYGYKHCLSK